MKRRYHRKWRHRIVYSKQRHTLTPQELKPTPSIDYVLISQGEMNMLSNYILDYPNNETGGQLFGYWTFDEKPVILFVLGPGPKAGHYDAFFMQDIDYLRECALLLKKKYGLDHIGEWHSHHQLGLSYPSGHDARNISNNIRKLGYSKFLLCIGTCSATESSINAFMFYSDKTNYDYVPWVIKDIDSPFRMMIKAIDKCAFDLPKNKLPNMAHLFLKSSSREHKTIDFKESYWLKQKGNSKVLKNIIDSLKEMYPEQVYIPTIDNNNEVHLELYEGDTILEDIHFTNSFPLEPPLINDSYGNILSKSTKWKFNGDIYNSFMTFYESFKLLYQL